MKLRKPPILEAWVEFHVEPSDNESTWPSEAGRFLDSLERELPQREVRYSQKANSRKKRRKIGGQPGHAKHERPPFSPEEIDDVGEYRLNCCPDCGGRVTAYPEPCIIASFVKHGTRW